MAVLMALLLPGVIIGYSHSAVGAHGADTHADGAEAAQDGAHTHTQAQVAQDGTHTQVAAHTERAYTAQEGAGLAYTAQEGADVHAGAQVDAQGADDADADAPVPAQKRTHTAQGAGAGMTREQRLRHIEESGVYDPAQVAAQYGIKLRTAQKDIADVRAGVLQVNGSAAHA